MKAGLYIRVSTEEQKIKGYSLPEQIDVCTRKAQELGITEIEIFLEEGESGAYIDRPALERLFTAVNSGDIQLVVSLDSDRLARDLGTQLYISEEIEKYAKLDFVTYSRGDKNNPEDTLFFQMKGAFSQYERAKIMQRTAYGRKRKALLGKIVIPGGWAGHPGAFGYKFINDNDGPRLEIVEEEARIVRYIFDLANRWHMGVMRIVKTLNMENIPSPKGSIWHSNTVGRMLKNETYAGTFYNYKYRSQMTSGRTSSGKRQHIKQLRPVSDRIPVAVPAIIERKVWETVQEQLKQSAHKTDNLVLLKGRLRCGLCGKNHVVMYSSPGRTYYRCKGTQTEYFPKCDLPSTPAISAGNVIGLDDLLWDHIVQELSNPGLIKQHLLNNDNEEAKENLSRHIEMLNARIKSLNKRKEEFLRLRLEELIDTETLKRQLANIKSIINDIMAEVKEAKQTLTSLNRATAFDVDRFCEYFSSKIQTADPRERVMIIRELDIRAVAYPGRKFEVYWPFNGLTSKVRYPDKAQYITHKPVSMTLKTKTIFDKYCEKNCINPSDLMRLALREAPEIKEKLPIAARSNRYRTTVLLHEVEWAILQRICEVGGLSYSRSMEWAIEEFFKGRGCK